MKKLTVLAVLLLSKSVSAVPITFLQGAGILTGSGGFIPALTTEKVVAKVALGIGRENGVPLTQGRKLSSLSYSLTFSDQEEQLALKFQDKGRVELIKRSGGEEGIGVQEGLGTWVVRQLEQQESNLLEIEFVSNSKLYTTKIEIELDESGSPFLNNSRVGARGDLLAQILVTD